MCSPVNLKSILLLVMWFVVFSPIIPELYRVWLNHSNNSHGILVPFVSLYFIWQKRDELKKATISSSYLGAVLLLASMAVYLLSLAGNVAFVSRLMMVVSLSGLVLYLFGKEIFYVISFPLLFLLFMVPVPDSFISIVSLPLQLFASNISSTIISAFSIPVYREGNMLYFVQTQLEVAEACSGIRSIVSLTMLSVIFIYLSRRGIGWKAVLGLSAIPIALVANIIRVTGTGILAHHFGDSVAKGFLHEFSGLAVFAFGFFVLYCEYSLLNKMKV